ncbi:hypothetical protein [Xenorhabdus lircayensis]|uniref:Uncharacterized protein n=1 Tax=Xenorhabdus lircayensis TaxID=2763499 RepID=A0ABS0U5V3_9GAMM|nr:hypothetical protein [Xenorhabdus lircayensis]MBI6549273.1 hypothetical protein [Xenorhabdus lircayensis]
MDLLIQDSKRLSTIYFGRDYILDGGKITIGKYSNIQQEVPTSLRRHSSLFGYIYYYIHIHYYYIHYTYYGGHGGSKMMVVG